MSDAPVLPTLLLIPTGIGCAQGGYAGDGLPVARLLAAASGCLITHPNVMNAASLYWSDRRIHYVEGWALDRFAACQVALAPRASQRLGVLLDAVSLILKDAHRRGNLRERKKTPSARPLPASRTRSCQKTAAPPGRAG